MIAPRKVFNSRTEIANFLGLSAVAVICVTAVPLANSGAYLAMAITLTALLAWGSNKFRSSGVEPAFPVMMLGSYGLIILGTLLAARTADDLLFVADFLPLALAAGLYCVLAGSGSTKIVRVIAHAAFFGVISGLVIGLYEMTVLGEQRAQGLGGSAIFFGTLSVLLGFLAVAPFFTKRGGQPYLLLGPAIGIVNALLSGTRLTLLVAAGLAITVIAFWFIHRRLKIDVRVIGMLCVGAIAVAFLGTTFGNFDRIFATFGTIRELLTTGTTTNYSAALRLDYYQAGVKAFLDSPLAGYGWHRAFEVTEPYREMATPGQPHLHNDLLNFLVAYGLVGLGAYVLLLFTPLVTLILAGTRASLASAYLVISVGVAYLLTGFLDVSFYFEAPKVLYCLLVAAAAASVTMDAGTAEQSVATAQESRKSSGLV